jgi:hypothetical protein
VAEGSKLATAWLNLRYTLPERRALFEAGLSRLGYEVCHGLPNATEGVLVTWNRIGTANAIAEKFEQAGLPVIVAENAAWGNEFAGSKWYSLALRRHNTAGMFPAGDVSRWDSLKVDLGPWRDGGETVILPQRGIGSKPTAMPHGWPQDANRRHGGRIRPHPGRSLSKPLRDDLAKAGRVVTWGSAAAVQALLWSIPVTSEMPDWIGEQDNTDDGRLAMFRRLAWAQWRHEEIGSGEAFAWLLASSA